MSASVILPEDNFQQAAGVFTLLSRLWANEVDAKTLNAMTQAPFADAWKDSGGQLPSATTDELVEELAVDYCQLLIGPKDHVSPIQSVRDQNRFQGNATESMQKYIQMVDGFQPCVDMVDHVAVQLQYAGVLLNMAEQTKRKLIQGLATAFCRDHLDWTKAFFERTEKQAQSDFYQSLSRVSNQFLFG